MSTMRLLSALIIIIIVIIITCGVPHSCFISAARPAHNDVTNDVISDASDDAQSDVQLPDLLLTSYLCKKRLVRDKHDGSSVQWKVQFQLNAHLFRRAPV